MLFNHAGGFPFICHGFRKISHGINGSDSSSKCPRTEKRLLVESLRWGLETFERFKVKDSLFESVWAAGIFSNVPAEEVIILLKRSGLLWLRCFLWIWRPDAGLLFFLEMPGFALSFRGTSTDFKGLLLVEAAGFRLWSLGKFVALGLSSEGGRSCGEDLEGLKIVGWLCWHTTGLNVGLGSFCLKVILFCSQSLDSKSATFLVSCSMVLFPTSSAESLCFRVKWLWESALFVLCSDACLDTCSFCPVTVWIKESCQYSH